MLLIKYIDPFSNQSREKTVVQLMESSGNYYGGELEKVANRCEENTIIIQNLIEHLFKCGKIDEKDISIILRNILPTNEIIVIRK